MRLYAGRFGARVSEVVLLAVVGLTWTGMVSLAAEGPKVSAERIPGNRMSHDGPVYCVCFSPDSKTLASASGDKTIKLWDVQTGKVQASLRRHTGWVESVVFSPDGKKLASGSWDKSAQWVEVKTSSE